MNYSKSVVNLSFTFWRWLVHVDVWSACWSLR